MKLKDVLRLKVTPVVLYAMSISTRKILRQPLKKLIVQVDVAKNNKCKLNNWKLVSENVPEGLRTLWSNGMKTTLIIITTLETLALLFDYWQNNF